MSPRGDEAERQRSVLPLPLKDDSWKEMKKVMDSGESNDCRNVERKAGFRGLEDEERNEKGGPVDMAWVGHGVPKLPVEWGTNARPDCPRNPIKGSGDVSERLWESVKVFVDDVSETAEKLVKRPRIVEIGIRGWRR